LVFKTGEGSFFDTKNPEFSRFGVIAREKLCAIC